MGGGKSLKYKIMNNKIYVLVLLFVAFIGCKKEDIPPIGTAYFGGKVENPRDEFIILAKNDNVIDTLYLKKDNTFFKKIDSIKTGLYYFIHGTERQYALIKPNDSLLIDLDASNFDESLIFKGTNAYENNLLLKKYLESEKEEEYFRSLHCVDRKTFKHKLDSVRQVKLSFLKQFKEKNKNCSKEFLDILQIASLYVVHMKLESYLAHRVKQETLIVPYKEILENRKIINLERDDEYMSYWPYYRVVFASINNDVYLKGYERNTDNFTSNFIDNVNKKISRKDLKNELSFSVTKFFLYMKESTEKYSKTLKSFQQTNSNEEKRQQIADFISDMSYNKKNDTLLNFKVVTEKNKIYDIHSLIKNKKVALFFNDIFLDKIATNKVNGFIKKYPKIQFYVINMFHKKVDFIKKINIKNQYFIPKNSKANDFCKMKAPRIILADKNGIITSDFVSPLSKDIELQLSKLQNK